jgi:hypothetical protein
MNPDNNAILQLMDAINEVCRHSGIDHLRQMAALNALALTYQTLQQDPNTPEERLEGIVLRSIFTDLCQAGLLQGIN